MCCFNDPNTSLLICDIRPDLQYKESHIRDKCCVNVPQDIIPPGYVISICRIHISGLCKFDFQLKSIWNSFSKLQKNTNRCKLGKCIEFSCFIISNRITLTYIEKALPDDSREMFSQRGSVDHIILLELDKFGERFTTRNDTTNFKRCLIQSRLDKLT